MMRTALALICLWAASGAAAHARDADPARVDSLLTLAADTILAYGNRVSLIKDAIKLDDSGRAMYELALLYRSRETNTGNYDALTWLRRALRKDRNNPDFRLAYASALWANGQRGNAYEQARKAIEANPDHVGALYLAARYAAWQMSRYLDGERVDYNYDDYGNQYQRTFSMELFGEQDRDEAIGYLTRALSVNPDHRPSLLLLGLVYYEARMPEKLVALFSDYIGRHPRDSEAWFVLGLGYQAQDNLDLAYPAYVKGLDLMTYREQQFMQSVFLMVGKEAAGEDALPDEDAIRAFWTGRDPLFLTPINERLMEHCGRVAYANLRFGDPERDIDGWTTDKGQAYIRYGRPVARSVQPAEINTGIDQPRWYQDYLAYEVAIRGTQPMTSKPRTEFWDYGNFRLVFVNTDMRDNWRFRVGWLGRNAMGLSELVRRLPEYYKDPYGWERYEAPAQVVQFRGAEGKSRVEVYYALAGEEVTRKEVRPGVQSVDLRQGLFLFDAEWDTLRREIGRVDKLPWVVYDEIREGYLFASEKLDLAPGRYYLIGEAEDRKTKTVGTFRRALNIRTFKADSLQLSDLLLARRIVELDDKPMARERFLILPNPLEQVTRSGDAYFYFEIYNLSKDPFGTTNYEVEYQVRALPEGEDVEIGEWTTAVSYTHRGGRDWEPIYQTLDLNAAMPGKRDFRVLVRDLNSNRVAVAETQFRVMW
jgi:GWxTD domain-containing protein